MIKHPKNSSGSDAALSRVVDTLVRGLGLDKRYATDAPGRPEQAQGNPGGTPPTRPAPIGYGPVGLGARRASTMTRSEARRRRRDVLFILGGAALVTLMLAVVVGGPLVWLHLAVDVVLLAYLGLLAHTQRLAIERRNKVRYLPQVGGMPDLEPSYLVPHSASANY